MLGSPTKPQYAVTLHGCGYKISPHSWEETANCSTKCHFWLRMFLSKNVCGIWLYLLQRWYLCTQACQTLHKTIYFYIYNIYIYSNSRQSSTHTIWTRLKNPCITCLSLSLGRGSNCKAMLSLGPGTTVEPSDKNCVRLSFTFVFPATLKRWSLPGSRANLLKMAKIWGKFSENHVTNFWASSVPVQNRSFRIWFQGILPPTSLPCQWLFSD